MDHILAAIDFSEQMKEVVSVASTMVKALGGRLTLLHVAAPEPDFVGYQVGPQTVRDSRAAKLSGEHAKIHRACEELQAHDINCHGLLVSGMTVNTIVDEANRFHCDLIVIGSHGHGPIYEVLLGSVATGVIRNAHCPVVVVPRKRS